MSSVLDSDCEGYERNRLQFQYENKEILTDYTAYRSIFPLGLHLSTAHDIQQPPRSWLKVITGKCNKLVCFLHLTKHKTSSTIAKNHEPFVPLFCVENRKQGHR
jgi:hypothetical protein